MLVRTRSAKGHHSHFFDFKALKYYFFMRLTCIDYNIVSKLVFNVLTTIFLFFQSIMRYVIHVHVDIRYSNTSNTIIYVNEPWRML